MADQSRGGSRFFHSAQCPAVDAIDVTACASGLAYSAIGDYGVIGNCRTAALVSRGGSIDWLCLPHFSAPSIFAALLDHARGGRLALRPREIVWTERCYVEGTNVLRTTFHCRSGEVRITDFMTLPSDTRAGMVEPEHELVRIVECMSGEALLDAVYMPRPAYGAHTPTIRRRGKLGWACSYRGLIAFLTSDLEFAPHEPGTLTATARLAKGDRRYVVFSYC